MDKMAALCVPIACDSNTHHGQLQTRRKSRETKRALQPLPQARIQALEEGISPTTLPPRSRISQDPKRSSLQITHRKATKNTQQHNHFWAFWESFFTQLMQREHIYIYINIWRVFVQGSIPKHILISPANVVYALFILNTKESRNQYCASHYGSTFEAVLHLQCNRPTSKFSQYLSHPWPPSSSPPWCYASA